MIERFRLWLRVWLGIDRDQHQLFIELRKAETRLESQIADIFRNRSEDAKRPEPRKRIVTRTKTEFLEQFPEDKIYVP